jgi:polyphosphate kinase 2
MAVSPAPFGDAAWLVPPSCASSQLVARLHAELRDDFDEELELELEDRMPELDGVALPQADDGMPRSQYFRELFRLQAELVKLQDWVAANGEKVLILFEGRDSAGKGGAIKRITQRLNPRVCRVVALPAPNDRERTQWYFQRYVQHLPAAGEMVLFDRSWYNRAGVERVMGFCDEDDVEEFFRSVPEFERMLVRSGIRLLKYWFSITDEQQHMRFLARIHDPLKQWKFSPWTCKAASAGKPIPRPRRRCWSAPTSPKRPGGWCRRWTRRRRG